MRLLLYVVLYMSQKSNRVSKSAPSLQVLHEGSVCLTRLIVKGYNPLDKSLRWTNSEGINNTTHLWYCKSHVLGDKVSGEYLLLTAKVQPNAGIWSPFGCVVQYDRHSNLDKQTGPKDLNSTM